MKPVPIPFASHSDCNFGPGATVPVHISPVSRIFFPGEPVARAPPGLLSENNYMAIKAAVSVEEYLRMSFSGLDCEYRDGEIVERTLPDYPHSRTQAKLIAFFHRLEQSLPLYVCPELRLKVTATRFMIPDVAVFSPEQPASAIPENPPLIAIEILSPDDRLTEVREKLEEYRRWGVPHVWLVDPHSRRLYVCTAGLSEVLSFHVPEFELQIHPADIFV